MQRLFGILLVLVLFLMPAAAYAATPSYSALYVFGDSYCDVGNLYAASPSSWPGYPYYQGRFSNGPIWVDHIAGYLGVPPLKPSLFPGGTDYAFAGAWVTRPQDLGGGAILPSVPMQEQMYLQASGGKADPDALYFLDGGGNDIVNTKTGNPEQLGYQIAAGLADSERMLRAAGARHFVIPNLFNVGLLPVAADHIDFAKRASAAANLWLDKLLRWDDASGMHIIRVDINSLMEAMIKDSTHFGMVNVSDPCLTDKMCDDPDHIFFWDVYHPTVFGYSFFAVAIETTLAAQAK